MNSINRQRLDRCRSLTPGFALIVLVLLLAGCSADGYTVTGKPTITAKQIDNILCVAHSPACGTGADLYRLGVKYDIDPVYALAWFNQESTFGTAGIARVTLSLGNIRCTYGYRCIEGYRAYQSYRTSYEDWYQLIAHQYVAQWKLTTVAAILDRYAPQSENDTSSYASNVEQSVDTWRSEAVGGKTA